jgi:hypothetical protein
MAVAVIWRKGITDSTITLLKLRKNPTVTKYQKTLLMSIDLRQTLIIRNGVLLIIHHSNPERDFSTADIVGKNGIMTTATISRE